MLTTVTNDHVRLAQFRVIPGTLPCDMSLESEFNENASSYDNWLLNGEAHMCTVGLRTAARRAAVRLVFNIEDY